MITLSAIEKADVKIIYTGKKFMVNIPELNKHFTASGIRKLISGCPILHHDGKQGHTELKEYDLTGSYAEIEFPEEK